ncbi:hypothetical protein, partial [Achromobacter sp.]|uniref:hypothetical protein n=1 Tax=Achromobacter sp. TaxID=134375 RepID=UPI0025846593
MARTRGDQRWGVAAPLAGRALAGRVAEVAAGAGLAEVLLPPAERLAAAQATARAAAQRHSPQQQKQQQKQQRQQQQ